MHDIVQMSRALCQSALVIEVLGATLLYVHCLLQYRWTSRQLHFYRGHLHLKKLTVDLFYEYRP